MSERRIEIEVFKVDPETGCLVAEVAGFLVTYSVEGTYYPGSVFEPAEYPEVEIEKIINEDTKEEVPFDVVFCERRPIVTQDKRFSFAEFSRAALDEWELETSNSEDYYDSGDD